ncbi:MAG: glutamine-hydrolyzing GMP synthase [Chlorobi bacterium]|nr:glutamine-hydrolyzing GMP synthase [Chlorobiota bacterium]
MQREETILILDYGSQYTQLIARRIRESNIYSEIHPHTFPVQKIKELKPKGIILSGGPLSVYDEGAPGVNDEIFSLGVPTLGICYGLQLIARSFGGSVEPARSREYGKAKIQLLNPTKLFDDVRNNSTVWMSHGDYINKAPDGFSITSRTENSPICSLADPLRNIYGVQFHPEVAHTEEGKKIVNNFLYKICGCKGTWTAENFIAENIKEIREKIGDRTALLALSGGVDSSVAAVLVDKAVGKRLVCIHVDNGLMRKNESEKVVKMFRDNYHLNLIHVNASDMFLSRLEGVTNPEKKRKIIGNTFIEVFENEAKKFDDVEYLVQGTLYPDVIESVSVKGQSATIKTHHNVGGLPERMNLKLLEPFRELFKDEVRAIGTELDLPLRFIERHPFPGPGLGVRILGEITRDRITVLQEADEIFIGLLHERGLYEKIWQAFSVLLPIQTVGVMGDTRTYENVIALRAVTSTDGMTADWYRFEPDFLEIVSNRIIRDVKGVNRVVYDISSKPPSTIEWE